MDNKFCRIRFPLILITCLSLVFPPELLAQAFGKTEYKEYDQYSRITKITDFNDHVIAFDYNGRGQLEFKRYYLNQAEYDANYPAGADPNIHYQYDALGRKTSETMSGYGTITYHYDKEGRVYQIDSPQGFVRYEFSDITGQKTAVRTPSEGADTRVEYYYDLLGRLAQVTVDKRNNVDVNEHTYYAYNTVGSIAKVTYPNGNTAAYTYDNLNRLTNLVHRNSEQTELASYAYTLAADGKRTRVTELDGTVIKWEYDALNRLLTEDYNAPGDANDFTHTYVYDLVGNRLEKQVAGGDSTYYSYDANGLDQLIQETTDANNIYYSYDDNGSLIEEANDAETIRTYTYNYRNRLASVDNGTTVVSYEYDTDGVRVQKSIAGGAVTNYLIDHFNHTGYPQVFKETTGSAQTAYIIGSEIISQSTGTDDPLYLLRDGHSSVRAAADSSGVITGNYHFDAYGQLLAHSDTPSTNILYAGQMFDSDIDLYNNWHRWYDPATGLFNSMDDFSGDNYDPPSLHKYLYAHANPINNIDPSGNSNIIDFVNTLAIRAMISGMELAPTLAAYTWAATKIAGITFLATTAYLGLSEFGWVPDYKAIRILRNVSGVVFLAAFVATGMLNAVPRVHGKVPYGSTNLSKQAQAARINENFKNARNVAVFEYKDNNGSLRAIVTTSKGFTEGGGHAERIAGRALETMNVPPSRVTQIYSELEPCNNRGGYCAKYISETFPQASVSWSFDYAEPATRAQGKAEWLESIDRLFNGWLF